MGAVGCDRQAACRSLEIGQSVSGLPANDYGVNQSWGKSSLRSEFGDFDRGPVSQVMCCDPGPGKAECEGVTLQCEDPAIQGTTIRTLPGPYSDLSRDPDDGRFCFIGVQRGRIVAVWSRYWS